MTRQHGWQRLRTCAALGEQKPVARIKLSCPAACLPAACVEQRVMTWVSTTPAACLGSMPTSDETGSMSRIPALESPRCPPDGEPPLEYVVDLNAMLFVDGARQNAASDGPVTANVAAEAFRHGYTLQVRQRCTPSTPLHFSGKHQAETCPRPRLLTIAGFMREPWGSGVLWQGNADSGYPLCHACGNCGSVKPTNVGLLSRFISRSGSTTGSGACAPDWRLSSAAWRAATPT